LAYLSLLISLSVYREGEINLISFSPLADALRLNSPAVFKHRRENVVIILPPFQGGKLTHLKGGPRSGEKLRDKPGKIRGRPGWEKITPEGWGQINPKLYRNANFL